MSVEGDLVKSGAAEGGGTEAKPIEHVPGDARSGAAVAERQRGARHCGQCFGIGEEAGDLADYSRTVRADE
jgi:hypothetical protein